MKLALFLPLTICFLQPFGIADIVPSDNEPQIATEFTGVTITDTSVVFDWTDSGGPYALQMAAHLQNATWVTVTNTRSNSIELTRDFIGNRGGFFRLINENPQIARRGGKTFIESCREVNKTIMARPATLFDLENFGDCPLTIYSADRNGNPVAGAPVLVLAGQATAARFDPDPNAHHIEMDCGGVVGDECKLRFKY